MREVINRGNLNPTEVQLGGNAIDLGGFRSLVHKHNIKSSIKLKLDIDLAEEDLPELNLAKQSDRHKYIDVGEAIDRASQELRYVAVMISIGWSEAEGAPVL